MDGWWACVRTFAVKPPGVVKMPSGRGVSFSLFFVFVPAESISEADMGVCDALGGGNV